MSKGSLEDENDVLAENFNTLIFLLLGILSVFLSAILLVHSATVAVYSQQLTMDFLYRSMFAALFFVIGLGSLHIFRKRRETRKQKKSALFLKSKA